MTKHRPMYFVRHIALYVALCGFAGRVESADWRTWTIDRDLNPHDNPESTLIDR